jgi:hypothetical protein
MPRSDERLSPGLAALAAASWANLALLDTWRALFEPARQAAAGRIPTTEAFWTCVVIIAAAAALGGVLAYLRNRTRRTTQVVAGDMVALVAAAIFGLTMWHVAGASVVTTTNFVGSLGPIQRVAGSLALLLLAWLALRNWRALMRTAVRGLLIFSPFLVFTLGRAGLAIYSADLEAMTRTVSSDGIRNAQPGARVIIVVFDELDYTHAFPGRPPEVALPAFDQLRSHSAFATNAVAPGAHTAFSLPSYILGTAVDSLLARSSSTMIFQTRDDHVRKDISRDSTIFDDAAGRGARSELVGFLLPYCRWRLAQSMERCTWHPFTWGGVMEGPIGLWPSVGRQILAMLTIGNRTAAIERDKVMISEALRAVSDTGLRLVFLHLPVPHFPPVWDAARKRYSPMRVSVSAYFENLALADLTLEQLRLAAGPDTPNRPTYWIVTSDHAWRYGPIAGRPGGKVPFLVSGPSGESLEINSPIETVRLRSLTAQLLDGKLKTNRDVAAWLAPATMPAPQARAEAGAGRR